MLDFNNNRTVIMFKFKVDTMKDWLFSKLNPNKMWDMGTYTKAEMPKRDSSYTFEPISMSFEYDGDTGKLIKEFEEIMKNQCEKYIGKRFIPCRTIRDDPNSYTEYEEIFAVWDNTKKQTLPCQCITYRQAETMADELNLLIKDKSQKPKPLKEEILEALGEIDISKYDMQNKILKQKEHIKELETKIKHLKNDVKNNQRSIDRLTRQDIENNNKYMCRVEEIDRLKCCNRELKREKETYRKRMVQIQSEIDKTYIPVQSKFNKIKRIMEGYYD